MIQNLRLPSLKDKLNKQVEEVVTVVVPKVEIKSKKSKKNEQ